MKLNITKADLQKIAFPPSLPPAAFSVRCCWEHIHADSTSTQLTTAIPEALQGRTLHMLRTIVQTIMESLQLEGAQSQQPQTGELSFWVLLVSQAGLATSFSSLLNRTSGLPHKLCTCSPRNQIAHNLLISLAWPRNQGPQHFRRALGLEVVRKICQPKSLAYPIQESHSSSHIPTYCSAPQSTSLTVFLQIRGHVGALLPRFILAPSTGTVRTTACTTTLCSFGAVCPWLSDIDSCIADASRDGCSPRGRQIGSGMGRMIDTSCKVLFCQSFVILLVVNPNHSAIASPQSYVMPNVHQIFHPFATTFSNSILRAVCIPSA